MATPAGFEPATCPLGGGCSIQLSHGAVFVYAIANPQSYHNEAQGLCQCFFKGSVARLSCSAPLY